MHRRRYLCRIKNIIDGRLKLNQRSNSFSTATALSRTLSEAADDTTAATLDMAIMFDDSVAKELIDRKIRLNKFAARMKPSTLLSESTYASRSLQELLPLLSGLLEADLKADLQQIDEIMEHLRLQRPKEWREITSPALFNMIFKLSLDKFAAKQLTWSDLESRFLAFKRDLIDCQWRPVDSITWQLTIKFILEAGRSGADSWEIVEEDLMILKGKILAERNIDIYRIVNEEDGILAIDDLAYIRKLWQLNKKSSVSQPESIDLKQSESMTRILPEIAEVRSIASKSEGISFIKDSLKEMTKLDPSQLENNSKALYQLQERLERDCYSAMIAKLKREADAFSQITKTGTIGNIRRELVEWFGQLERTLEEQFDKLNNGEEAVDSGEVNNPQYYLAILSVLDSEKIAAIVIQELLKLPHYEYFFSSMNEGNNENQLQKDYLLPKATGSKLIYGAKLTTLALNIGNALQREIFADQVSKRPFLQKSELSPQHLAQIFEDRRTLDKKMRQVYAKMEGDLEAKRDGWIPSWPPTLKTEIGVYLLSLASNSLFFTPKSSSSNAESPRLKAFTHEVVYSGNTKRQGVLRIHEDLYQRLVSERNLTFVEAWAMPMLVPPKPWLTFNSGGYLTQKNVCVRLKDDPVHLNMIHDAEKEKKLDNILMGLDVLGRVPWIINERILKVAIELWNAGVNVSALNEQSMKEKYNSSSGGIEEFPYKKKEDFGTAEEYREYCRQAINHKNEQTREHSMTCDTNYKLEIARQFVGFKFYLPHSVDFRGRAYPIPPHLNHIGSDLSRGLLLFGEGRKLGEKGLFWLKVQFANMCGFDKHSLEKRAKFADEHWKEIEASVKDPMALDAFWRRADEPWQCLAVCYELFEAVTSGNPNEFISRLPVQQDGSCNGSQHYAALGGDIEGAEQVNLAPSSTPQDIYGTVAKIVAREIDADAAASGILDEKSMRKVKLAKLLQGKINRKIVKQPVMTNIYGVTLYGAKKQIEARLKEFNIIPAADLTLMKEAREYLTLKVFGALDELFVKARQIQDWLTFCAEEICRAVDGEVAKKYGYQAGVNEIKDGGDKACLSNTWNPVKDYGERRTLGPADRYPQTPVTWTTPLSFRVLQPYLKPRSFQLKTVLQLCSLQSSTQFDPVDASKQVAAFPPNFIHSLDATHMFRTALACYSAGLTFASVHDCFWTHAGTVEDMNRILREEFVAMHSEPILERLRDEFLTLYKDYKVPVLVTSRRNGKTKKAALEGESDETGSVKTKLWRDIYIPPVPVRGEFDLRQVLASPYFFS